MLKIKHPIVFILSCLTAVPALIVGVGLCFHTSFDPTILGKYTTGYFLFLIGWFAVVVPASFLFGRFVFSTQTVKLSGGRTGHVRPRHKIVVLLLAGMALIIVGEQLMRSRVTETAATLHRDRFHPFLQNTPRSSSGRFHINDAGFRGEEITLEKPPGTYRIFILGGSTVFCGETTFEDTHPRILEKELRKLYPDRRIEVLNAGADWHWTIKFLFNIQDYDPDMVIVFHAINDLLRTFRPDEISKGRYKPDYRHYHGAVANMVRPTHTVWRVLNIYAGYWCSDFLRDRVRVIGPYGKGVNGARMLFFPKAKPVEVEQWLSLPAFDRNMRDLVRILKARDIEVVMGNQPFLYKQNLSAAELEVLWFPMTHRRKGSRPSLESMRKGMELYNAKSEQIAREEGVHFVDLESHLPKTLEYFYDDVHFKVKGSEAVAHAFRDYIRDAGLLQQE